MRLQFGGHLEKAAAKQRRGEGSALSESHSDALVFFGGTIRLAAH
jgi:hypothetical protein